MDVQRQVLPRHGHTSCLATLHSSNRFRIAILSGPYVLHRLLNHFYWFPDTDTNPDAEAHVYCSAKVSSIMLLSLAGIRPYTAPCVTSWLWSSLHSVIPELEGPDRPMNIKAGREMGSFRRWFQSGLKVIRHAVTFESCRICDPDCLCTSYCSSGIRSH